MKTTSKQLLRCLILERKSQMTQQKFSEKMGYSQGFVSKLEKTNIEDWSVRELLEYAITLGINVSFTIEFVKK